MTFCIVQTAKKLETSNEMGPGTLPIHRFQTYSLLAILCSIQLLP